MVQYVVKNTKIKYIYASDKRMQIPDRDCLLFFVKAKFLQRLRHIYINNTLGNNITVIQSHFLKTVHEFATLML